jgi:hypothetical protein
VAGLSKNRWVTLCGGIAAAVIERVGVEEGRACGSSLSGLVWDEAGSRGVGRTYAVVAAGRPGRRGGARGRRRTECSAAAWKSRRRRSAARGRRRDGRLLEVIDEQADNPANLNLTPVRVEGDVYLCQLYILQEL